MNTAFFLDRDGVLNRANVRCGKPYAPTTLAEFELLPRVAEAVDIIKRLGYLVIVVTNQPDVGNGKADRKTVERMHEYLRQLIFIDEIFTCYHSQTDECDCRKPRPGMLFSAAERFNIDLTRSFMVGDRSSDIAAGIAAGCTTAFIDANYEEEAATEQGLTVSSLYEAVTTLIEDHQ